MSTTDSLLERVRTGEIVHLSAPRDFAPLFNLLTGKLEEQTGITEPFPRAFGDLSWEQLEPALGAVVKELDCTREHYRLLAQALLKNTVSEEEGLLHLTLDKSFRLCLTGRHKKNYGYFVHRDSWFDLAPDGVNIVLYLNDVPCHGNTLFYEDYFGVEVPYDPKTRRVLDESGLSRVTSFHCKAGDALIFSGDQLHSGALCETNRFSVEFRLSRHWEYGRRDQGITYRGVRDFIAPEHTDIF